MRSCADYSNFLNQGELIADRVVVVADQCTDSSQAMVLEEFPFVVLVETERVLRSAGARRQGLRYTDQEFVSFIDDDNIVDRACLRELVRLMALYPRVGLLGPLMLRFPPGSGVWCAGGERTAMGVRHRREKDRVLDPDCPGTLKPCDYLPNAFLARRQVVTSFAPFDTEVFPHNFSEQDQGVRVQGAGYEIRVAPSAVVWHDCGYRSLTTRLGPSWQIEDQSGARLLFRRRWARGLVPWLGFWTVAFPMSSVYYLARFARHGHLAAWSAAYLERHSARRPRTAHAAACRATVSPHRRASVTSTFATPSPAVRSVSTLTGTDQEPGSLG